MCQSGRGLRFSTARLLGAILTPVARQTRQAPIHTGIDRLEGLTVAGGPLVREQMSRVLGIAALVHRGVGLSAVGWVVDHLEVEIVQSDGAPLLIVVERFSDGSRGFLKCGELNLGYKGQQLDPLIEAALRRVASQTLLGARLEDLAALLVADPKTGTRGQPLPRAADSDRQRFVDGALLCSWGAPGIWCQFFAVAEIARAQLDSLDTFNRSLFVQHCEAECLAVSPQTGVDMIPLVLYPWDDRIRRIDWDGRGRRCIPEPSRLFTTDLDEQDVILGRGPDKLNAALEHLQRCDLSTSSMIFCSSTCLPVVSGEDVEAVVCRHEHRLAIPLLHLTTTPHSMQALLRGLLVTRRLEAEASVNADQERQARPSINLVGFPEDPCLEELQGVLETLGVTVNAVIIPALGPELIDIYPRASLSVLHPNELWQGHYSQLMAGSRVRTVALAPPFGPARTRAWLQSIVTELSLEAHVDGVFEQHWSAQADEWKSLRERAQRYCLGFVVAEDEIDFLTNSRKTWGVSLIPLVLEMGFQVQVMLVCTESEESSAFEALQRLAANDIEIMRCVDREELSRALGRFELSAVFSEHFYDRRLTEHGVSSFSLQHFEHGFSGAVRTLRRLVELCEFPFFKRYGTFLKQAAIHRAGQVPPLGDAVPSSRSSSAKEQSPVPPPSRLKFLVVNQTPFGDKFLPLGVLKVGTAIREALETGDFDGEVKILDPLDAMASKKQFEHFLATLISEAKSSSFVGFSDFTFYSEEPLRTYIESVREANSDALVALGGWGPTLSPKHYAESLAPDLIVHGTFGEALEAVRAVVPRLAVLAERGITDKATRLDALSDVPGLLIDGLTDGYVEVTTTHDRVHWDLESFGLDPNNYAVAEQDTSRFPYEVRKSELDVRDLLVPYQFFRVSCPNHWRRRGCSFCAMAEQANRLRGQGRLPKVLHSLDGQVVVRELQELRQRFAQYRLHLFIVDDALTARTLKIVKELLLESRLVESLYLVSLFVRPDVITSAFQRHLEELGEAGVKVKLFIGLDFMVQRLNDISSTRKRVDRYDELIRSLKGRDHLEVVYSFIQNHPQMTPNELREHLDAIKTIAFSTDALISIAPFIFLVDSIDIATERVPVIYRGYYLSQAVKEIFGVEPMPKIERFSMTREELEESLDVIDLFLEELGEAREGLGDDEIALANARQLETFLPMMREYILWQLTSSYREHVEADELLMLKREQLPEDALARRR